MKKLSVLFLSIAALFVSSATAGEKLLSEAQKEYIDSFPLILVIRNTEKDSTIEKKETFPGSSGEITFYTVTTRLTGQVTEALRARNVQPGLIKPGMACVSHVTYRDGFSEKPVEGKQKITQPTEKIIYVKTYEVKEGGVLNILEYDGHIPPSSWDTVRKYIGEQKN